jgi:hypothetical protein
MLARLPRESHRSRDAFLMWTPFVGAEHFPRRVANHGIKAAIG